MSHITVRDTALAAASIYGNDDFEGATLLGGFFDPKNDFAMGWESEGTFAKTIRTRFTRKPEPPPTQAGGSGGIYRYTKGKDQYILSYRGSHGGKDWLTDDRQIGMNFTVDRLSSCIDYAEQVKKQYKGAFIMVTGHSLGGFLAQMVGVMCGMPFVTYNAPPASRALSGVRGVSKFKDGINLRVSWDPVSKAPGNHIGPLVTLPHYGFNVFDAHGSSAFLESVEKSGFADNVARAFITRNNR
jgi:hypothetical protein